MSSPRTIVVELSEEHARWIDDRIASGEYPDEAALVRESIDNLALETVLDEMPTVELTDEALRIAVTPAYERWVSGTGITYTGDEVRERLEARARDLDRQS